MAKVELEPLAHNLLFSPPNDISGNPLGAQAEWVQTPVLVPSPLAARMRPSMASLLRHSRQGCLGSEVNWHVYLPPIKQSLYLTAVAEIAWDINK